MAKVNIAGEEHPVLFTGYNTEEVRRLGIDASNCAVLDSACSSTVCGDRWINNYIESLDMNDKEKVKQSKGQKVFKFGGGTRLMSKGEYSLPAVIAGKEVIIKTDVVQSDIPLLLSRTAMKKAAIKLDLENDTAVIMGKEVALNLTSSGHYCIPIDKSEEVSVENVCAVNLDALNRKDRYKTLLKLHRQFAHPPMKRLIALLKDAAVWKDEYEETLAEIGQKCELCKVYAKTPSRPVVGMPMATKFNEKVAMDLKQWNGRWILHIIDMWSRYTLSVFVDRKKPCNIVEALMTEWIGKFGVMRALMTDNGGEFNADEVREITSILNVQLCTTSGESPFQNGLCERVHAITDMMLVKLEADYRKKNSQTLLSWANMARNSLQMWNGYSSHQLVFGQNPNLPNIMNDTLPALQGTTSSEVFAQHLNALHAARKAFIETEADERIRRALRNKVRASEQVFENGDRVFYKREGRERWLGPGKVVFQDGKVVFVRHGGVFVRVSPNRLRKLTAIEQRGKRR
ncbi:MAG: transposase [Candidatus Thiodiazotropha endolucinida]|nr:transposase [Candidatus Thiodiazotropha taylori]MCW4262746.1 transposase [Candidatus Thiodiazotropha endolucinida]